jgi:hypothetical protein
MCLSSSWEQREFAFRIETRRSPAELAPRFRAAQPLIERKASGPFAGFGGDGGGENDLRQCVEPVREAAAPAR